MKTLAITIMMMMILIVPLLVIIPITVNINNANAAGYKRLSEQLSENRGFRGPTLSTSSEPIRGPVPGTASP
jgi:hypothetical protein